MLINVKYRKKDEISNLMVNNRHELASAIMLLENCDSVVEYCVECFSYIVEDLRLEFGLTNTSKFVTKFNYET